MKTPYDPHSPYAASKAAADHLVRAYHTTYGLPALISNCCNNYGPKQHPEKLIPHAVHKILAGLAVPLYGDGQNVRDWIYVLDHCRAIEKMLHAGKPGKTYLVSAHQTKTNQQCLNILADCMKSLKPGLKWHQCKKKFKLVPDRPGHDKRYALDGRQTQTDLGWIPLESFESGIHKTITWYLNNSRWCKQAVKKGYKFERLGTTR
ncbi:MAG: dTDP-glucose 4,6-dehydratase [uncultured bacterium]|nr:MAG: dTDP-glucose 4,6-dehydratase [uncultured bacterium]